MVKTKTDIPNGFIVGVFMCFKCIKIVFIIIVFWDNGSRVVIFSFLFLLRMKFWQWRQKQILGLVVTLQCTSIVPGS